MNTPSSLKRTSSEYENAPLAKKQNTTDMFYQVLAVVHDKVNDSSLTYLRFIADSTLSPFDWRLLSRMVLNSEVEKPACLKKETACEVRMVHIEPACVEDVVNVEENPACVEDVVNVEENPACVKDEEEDEEDKDEDKDEEDDEGEEDDEDEDKDEDEGEEDEDTTMSSSEDEESDEECVALPNWTKKIAKRIDLTKASHLRKEILEIERISELVGLNIFGLRNGAEPAVVSDAICRFAQHPASFPIMVARVYYLHITI